MTYESFYTLIGEATICSDSDLFVAEWSTSSIFPEDADLVAVAEDLRNIWTLSHMTVRDLIAAAGISQTKLAKQFCIPLRTVQSWAAGTNECPIYTRLMMADLLGLIPVERA